MADNTPQQSPLDPNDPLLFNAPSMGVNYGSLAQMAGAPISGVVPGGNPAGNIGTAGAAMYLGGQQAMRDSFLNNASGLASLDAMLKGNQAKDYMLGEPGRLADINVKNSLAQGRADKVGTLLGLQSDQIDTAAGAGRMQKVQQELAQTVPYAQFWISAKTDEAKKLVRDKMKADGVTKIGAHNIDDLSDKELDGVMKASYQYAINTPAQAQALQKVEAEGDAWVKRYAELNKGREYTADRNYAARVYSADEATKRAQLYTQSREKIAEWAKTQDPKTTDALLAQLIAKKNNGTISDQEQDSLVGLLQFKLSAATVRAQTAPPQLNPGAVPPMNGQPTLVKPPVPDVPTAFMPKPQPQPPQPQPPAPQAGPAGPQPGPGPSPAPAPSAPPQPPPVAPRPPQSQVMAPGGAAPIQAPQPATPHLSPQGQSLLQQFAKLAQGKSQADTMKLMKDLVTSKAFSALPQPEQQMIMMMLTKPNG